MKSITYCFMVMVVGLQGCASLMVPQEPVKVIQPTVVQNFEFSTTGSEFVMPYQVFHDSKNTYLQFKADQRPKEIWAQEMGGQRLLKAKQMGQLVVIQEIPEKFTVIDSKKNQATITYLGFSETATPSASKNLNQTPLKAETALQLLPSKPNAEPDFLSALSLWAQKLGLKVTVNDQPLEQVTTRSITTGIPGSALPVLIPPPKANVTREPQDQVATAIASISKASVQRSDD